MADDLETLVAETLANAVTDNGRYDPDGIEWKHWLVEARAAIAAVREWDKGQPQPQLRFEPVEGRDLEEFHENLYKTKLYQIGDAVLVWVNEGDLCNFYPPFSMRQP